jgi:predicted amidohydrolase YtcJ
LSTAVTLVVLAFSMAPVPGWGAEPANPSAAAPEIEADLVLEGAAVYTVDPARTWAEAVAIRGDEILYVGGNKGAARYIGPQTRVVNLAGKMVLPGFQDAHVHPLWAGIEQLQ